MAVKFGKALGLDVTVISTSESKRKTAMQLGADHFLISKDEKEMLVSPDVLCITLCHTLLHYIMYYTSPSPLHCPGVA